MCASSDSRLCPTLILGLGNRQRGDDGAGPAAIDALRGCNLPGAAQLLDGGMPGLEIVLLFEDFERVIVIDAAEMGLAPGQWRRFTPSGAAITVPEGALTGTLHNAGLAEALALARALEVLPPTLIIYGIEPGRLDWQEGLSAPVLDALPYLVRAVRAEL
jgi:hydrogenase maturation protease